MAVTDIPLAPAVLMSAGTDSKGCLSPFLRLRPTGGSRLAGYLAPTLAAELVGSGAAANLATLTSYFLPLLRTQSCRPSFSSDLACPACDLGYCEHWLSCHSNKTSMPAWK
jgi:hypothetical protein